MWLHTAPAVDHNRSTQRKLVGLLVKLAHKGVDEFASKYATNLSDGGMFIRTREPKPAGTELSFKVEIADGLRVLQGVAVVRWTRADGDPNGPPGMGLEFIKLDPASRALVDRMLGKDPAASAPVRSPPSVPAQIAPAVAPATTPSKGLPVAASVPKAPTVAPATTPSKGLPVAAPVPKIPAPIAPGMAPSRAAPVAPPRAPAKSPAPSFDLADELFADVPAPSAIQPAPLDDEPFEASAAFAAPPPAARPLAPVAPPLSPAPEAPKDPVAPVTPPRSPAPEAPADPDVFGALASSPSPEKEIDIDLDALVAETPQPPSLDLFESSDSGFDVELEEAVPVPAAPFVPPPTRARPVEPVSQAAPVVLDGTRDDL